MEFFKDFHVCKSFAKKEDEIIKAAQKLDRKAGKKERKQLERN
jgi:hypothetical protein